MKKNLQLIIQSAVVLFLSMLFCFGNTAMAIEKAKYQYPGKRS